MKKHFLFLLILFVSVAHSQEPRLSARTDSTEYKIGEWIILRVQGEYAANVETIKPAVTDSLGPFELMNVTAGEPTQDGDRKRQEWTFRLIHFDTGRVFVPPIDFRYSARGDTTLHSAASNPVLLSVTGLSIDPNGDIKDIKPPVAAPWKFEDLWPYVLALLVLLLAGTTYYYYRKKKKAKEEAFVPIERRIPPHELALLQLRELEDKRLWQQGKVKHYYSEVSEIVRRFFEGRFHFLALELTSDEILDQLRRFGEAAPFRKDLIQFFTTADLVKFAKYEPSPEEHEKELKWAYEIVRGLALTVRNEDEESKEVTVDDR